MARKIARALLWISALWAIGLSHALVTGVIPEQWLERLTPYRFNDASPQPKPAPAPAAPAEPAVVEDRAPPQPVRHLVCAASESAGLSRVEVPGVASPTWAISCGAQVHLVSLRDKVPLRVARFIPRRSEDGQALHSGPPASGDVDGDGVPDLLLPLWQTRGAKIPTNIPMGGSLYMARGLHGGGFGPAVALANPTATAVALGVLDAAPGLDIVVLHRRDHTIGRSGQVWSFSGGPAPLRRSVSDVGRKTLGVLVLDLNLDGRDDILTISAARPGVDLLLSNTEAHSWVHRTLPLAAPREVVAGDLSGDGRPDALILGDGAWVIEATEAGPASPRPLQALASLRSVRLIDMQGDGQLDAVGYAHPHVIRLDRSGDGFAEQARLRLAAGSAPLAALDVVPGANDTSTLLLLTVASDDGDGRVELIVVEDWTRQQEIHLDGVQAPLADATLSLQQTLP